MRHRHASRHPRHRQRHGRPPLRRGRRRARPDRHRPIVVVGEERRAGLRPGAPLVALRRQRRRRADPRRRRRSTTTPGVELSSATRSSPLDPVAGTATTAVGPDDRLRRLRAGHRLVPVRAADRRHRRRRRRSCTARSTTSTRSGPGPSAARPASSSAAACSASRRPTPCACSGSSTTVVEFAPRLMAVQLDDGGGRALRRHVEALGIDVRTGAAAAAVRTTADGRVAGLAFADGADDLDADLVVFAAGIRPRDQLARDAGLAIGERGGVVVDDRCATSAAGVFAIGEVACHGGRVLRARRPRLRDGRGRRRPPRRRRRRRSPAPTCRPSSSCSASTSPASATRTPTGDEVVVADPPTRHRSRRSSSTPTAGCSAPCSSATPRAYADARPGRARHRRRRPTCSDLLRPAGRRGRRRARPTCPTTPASARATTSSCGDDAGRRRRRLRRRRRRSRRCTKAGTGCGSCVPVLQELLDAELRGAGQDGRQAALRRTSP